MVLACVGKSHTSHPITCGVGVRLAATTASLLLVNSPWSEAINWKGLSFDNTGEHRKWAERSRLALCQMVELWNSVCLSFRHKTFLGQLVTRLPDMVIALGNGDIYILTSKDVWSELKKDLESSALVPILLLALVGLQLHSLHWYCLLLLKLTCSPFAFADSAFSFLILGILQEFSLQQLDCLLDDRVNILAFSIFNQSHSFFQEFAQSLNQSWQENCDHIPFTGPAVSFFFLFQKKV